MPRVMLPSVWVFAPMMLMGPVVAQGEPDLSLYLYEDGFETELLPVIEYARGLESWEFPEEPNEDWFDVAWSLSAYDLDVTMDPWGLAFEGGLAGHIEGESTLGMVRADVDFRDYSLRGGARLALVDDTLVFSTPYTYVSGDWRFETVWLGPVPFMIYADLVTGLYDGLELSITSTVFEVNDEHRLLLQEVSHDWGTARIDLGYDYGEGPSAPDLRIAALDAPSAVERGEPFDVSVRVENCGSATAKYDFDLRLFDGDPDADRDQVIDHPLPVGVREVAVSQRIFKLAPGRRSDLLDFHIRGVSGEFMNLYAWVNGNQSVKEPTYVNNVDTALIRTLEPPITESWVSARTGSDTSGDGSREAPWATLAHALVRDQTGQIFMLPGTYDTGVVIESFPSDLRIVGRSEIDDAVIIDGAGRVGSAIELRCGYVGSAELIVEGLAITGFDGAAICVRELRDGRAVFRNNLIYENHGDAFYIKKLADAAVVEVSNNTAANNEARVPGGTGAGVGVSPFAYGTVAMVNNILWGNEVGVSVNSHCRALVLLAFNDVGASSTVDYLCIEPGETDRSEDPIFDYFLFDPPYSYGLMKRPSYGLDFVSPCIDSGTSSWVFDPGPTYSYELESGFFGAGPDLGALEYRPSGPPTHTESHGLEQL